MFVVYALTEHRCRHYFFHSMAKNKKFFLCKKLNISHNFWFTTSCGMYGYGYVLSQETHILHEFPEDFYGAELRVCVAGYIRDERGFPSLGRWRSHWVGLRENWDARATTNLARSETCVAWGLYWRCPCEKPSYFLPFLRHTADLNPLPPLVSSFSFTTSHFYHVT